MSRYLDSDNTIFSDRAVLELADTSRPTDSYEWVSDEELILESENSVRDTIPCFTWMCRACGQLFTTEPFSSQGCQHCLSSKHSIPDAEGRDLLLISPSLLDSKRSLVASKGISGEQAEIDTAY